MEQMGLLHLYYGDGKGKTTAAMGLALRALGHGRRVVILQFLKDGSSGEIEMLRRCGAAVYACPNAKFTWLMTDAERAEARRTNTRTLQTVLQGSFDLLVLDEACAACRHQLVDEALLRQAAAISSCVFPAWIISSASITGIPLPRAAVRVSMMSIFPSTISLAIRALW